DVPEAVLGIVVAYEKDSRAGVSDCTRAIPSMLLTAWAEGVGSNWTGFGGLDGVRNKVRLPDRYEVLAVVPLGYPARPVKGSKKRKSLSEVASAERFGTPFAKEEGTAGPLSSAPARPRTSRRTRPPTS